MAELIELETFVDPTGKLTVIDKVLPFEIKRVYYIYDANGQRGGHSHKKTQQALICINGSCSVFVKNASKQENYLLDSPKKCLILNPQDWHIIENFTKNSVLLVMASTNYDKNDYIMEEKL